MKGRPCLAMQFHTEDRTNTNCSKLNIRGQRGAFDNQQCARKSNILNCFEINPFRFLRYFIFFLSYGRFLIKRIYCKFLPNSDINGPVNRQFSQASRRKPFGPLFYSQTFRSLTVAKTIWAIILSQTIDCDEKQGKDYFVL